MNETISAARALIERLARARAGGPGALVFDADGTLWSGDVSEDTFEYAVSRGLLRAAARDALAEDARAHGLEATGDASLIAGTIFQAYRDGRYPERDVCRMMTWCYAGFTRGELDALGREALEAAGLEARTNRALEPVILWARREGFQLAVVSASPAPLVALAAPALGFSLGEIAASTPRFDAARMAPALSFEVPYAESKLPAARALIGDADWLASFGDSAFDEAMLRAARVGVAVRPKPALRARLGELPHVVIFDAES